MVRDCARPRSPPSRSVTSTASACCSGSSAARAGGIATPWRRRPRATALPAIGWRPSPRPAATTSLRSSAAAASFARRVGAGVGRRDFRDHGADCSQGPSADPSDIAPDQGGNLIAGQRATHRARTSTRAGAGSRLTARRQELRHLAAQYRGTFHRLALAIGLKDRGARGRQRSVASEVVGQGKGSL